MKTFKFSEKFSRGDLTKWGASDFYDDKAEEIRKAISSGLPFDTDWGGCKKEIVSSRVSFDGKQFLCQVSVSDDFDTEGVGEVFTNRGETDEKTWDNIEKAIIEAAEKAKEDQKDSAVYRGFSLIKDGSWAETYIQNVGAWESDSPPGDYYHKWGFQEEKDLDKETQEKIEEWIMGYPDDNETFEINGWKVECWDKKSKEIY